MAESTHKLGGPHQRRLTPALWGLAAFLLVLPWAAMKVTKEVAWDAADFVIFGAMLLVACGTYELVAKTGESLAYRAGVGMALVTAFILVWMNLAVGLLGNEDNPANLMYVGVLAIGALGASLARLQPRGMARSLAATTVAQAVVGAIGVAAFDTKFGQTLVLTAIFAALWLGSAGWFLAAARRGVIGAP